MIVFPNAKINLGLYITSKRADGYHNLETVFYPIAYNDALEIIKAPNGVLQFSQTGLNIPGEASDNICIKAYQLLKKRFPELPAVHIHLHKNIPTGAGLGGGSSNGAHTLLVLNRLFSLSLTQQQLADDASLLGSDCSFFIYNTCMAGSGRGEILSPFSLALSGYSWLVIHPGIHVSTAQAFSNINAAPAPDNWNRALLSPVKQWRKHVSNDFEKSVFVLHPEIAHIKSLLYNEGALFASLSGSGSAVFGIFEKDKLPTIQWPPHYGIKAIP